MWHMMGMWWRCLTRWVVVEFVNIVVVELAMARVSQPVAYANRSPTYLVHHPLGLVRLPVSIQSQPSSLDEASGDVYGRR